VIAAAGVRSSSRTGAQSARRRLFPPNLVLVVFDDPAVRGIDLRLDVGAVRGSDVEFVRGIAIRFDWLLFFNHLARVTRAGGLEAGLDTDCGFYRFEAFRIGVFAHYTLRNGV
jgi:hypothetical protein